jgi:hypothetical protein
VSPFRHVKHAANGPRTGGWLSRSFGYRPFLVLLALGVLVRVATIVMYFPAWMQSNDEVRFARLGTGIFSDYWMPAGYAVFARGMRAVTSELWVTIAVQHIVGLSIGVSLYLAVRRLGVKPWIACIPAAVAFLSGDQVWIEHQVVAETFMTAFLAGGLACAIRGLVPKLDIRWLAAGSALVTYAGLSRNVGLVAVPVLVLCTALWVRGARALRARALAAAIVPAIAVFGLYVAVFEVSNGQYLGISDMSGWNLYSRVAPIADCSKFTPPPGTRRLCENTPVSEREGSLGYSWDLNSRGRKVVGLEPGTSALVGSFAREAIIHEPLSYLKLVATDAARYIDPSIGGERAFSGIPHEIQSFGLVDPVTREFIEGEMSRGYSGTHVHIIGRGVLRTYQDLFRISGLLVAALLILTLIGMWAARGAVRLGVFLFGATGLFLYLVPVAVLSYEYRYGIPPLYFITASGVLGLVALMERQIPRSAADSSAPGQAGGDRHSQSEGTRFSQSCPDTILKSS